MSGLLPSSVAAAVTSRWPDRGKQWSETVDTELAQLLDRYAARPTAVMRARYSLVVEVQAADGRYLVLRGNPDPAGRDQYLVSAELARLGVGPAIYEFTQTETGTWTVAESIKPGIPIGDLDWSRVDPAAIGTALRPLVGQPAPSPELPSLYGWLRERLLAGDALTDLAPSATGPAPAAEREQALVTLDELSAHSRDGICHGDASPRNLLTSDTRGILLIDPRGVSGEVEYDAAVVALKAAPVIPTDETVPYLSSLVGVDSHRVRRWLTVASAARV